jgi:phosphatidylglycerophosphate synthase
MFDRIALKITKPFVDRLALHIFNVGFNADQVTLAAFGFGMFSALLISFDHSYLAILPLLMGRVLDGLDGAVARLSTPTERGAFMDIGLDFLFYAAVPLAFAIADRETNALAGAVLLAAFVGTGTSFLAYAIMAEKRGEKSTDYPSKSFYYLGGLTEGFETVICFLAMCIWPQHFALFAYIYAAMCLLTTATRLVAGWRNFGPPKP